MQIENPILTDKAATPTAPLSTPSSGDEVPVSLNETGILEGLTTTTVSVPELISRVGSKILWGSEEEEFYPSQQQFADVLQLARHIVLIDTCNDTEKYRMLPPEAKQLHVTTVLEEKYPDCSFQVRQPHVNNVLADKHPDAM